MLTDNGRTDNGRTDGPKAHALCLLLLAEA